MSPGSIRLYRTVEATPHTAGSAPVAAARIGRVPVMVAAAIAFVWTLAAVAQATGSAEVLHHDALIEGGLAYPVALALFLFAWQAMTAAMMLPSSLPLVRLFASVSSDQPRARAIMAGFLGGYALVWTAFGALAFSFDLVVHDLVHRSAWLAAHEWLFAGGVLVLAGAFQFSDLKDQCLKKCRHPGVYLMRHYERGPRSAFRLGSGHGLFCVGCCWALMLVMFAAGVANLWWMVSLTTLMVYEKTARGGETAVPIAGVFFLAYGALVLAHPGWLPSALSAG